MREEKRWLRHENGFRCFSLLAAALIKQPEGKGQTKHPSGPPKMTANNPKNIRELILDFTALFGEINPDNPIFADEVSRGSKGLFLPFSPLFGERR